MCGPRFPPRTPPRGRVDKEGLIALTGTLWGVIRPLYRRPPVGADSLTGQTYKKAYVNMKVLLAEMRCLVADVAATVSIVEGKPQATSVSRELERSYLFDASPALELLKEKYISRGNGLNGGPSR